jgi:hypothetical protein
VVSIAENPPTYRVFSDGELAAIRTGLELVASLMLLPQFGDEDRVMCLAEVKDILTLIGRS